MQRLEHGRRSSLDAGGGLRLAAPEVGGLGGRSGLGGYLVEAVRRRDLAGLRRGVQVAADLGEHLDEGPAPGLGVVRREDPRLRLVVCAALPHARSHEPDPRAIVPAPWAGLGRTRVGAQQLVGEREAGVRERQADGAAFTFAKRYALCAALNIVVDKDADARLLGDTITPEEADDLQRRARERWPDDEHKVGLFLKFCGVGPGGWRDIVRSRYDAALAELNRQPTPPAQPLNPCPADLNDQNAWREAMVVEMARRWQCEMTDADKVLAERIKAATKRGPLTPERRGAAWHNLLAGGFDAHRPAPKPEASAGSDLFPAAKPSHPDAPRSKR